MKNIAGAALLFLLLVSGLYADKGADLAKQLGLDASSKAIQQWERVFEQDSKMEKLGITKLSASDKAELKEYLTKHAADSDQPAAAGM